MAHTIASTWRRTFGVDAPGKLLCVGLNYLDHSAESGQALPLSPLLFGKFSNTLVDYGEPIVLPPGAGHVDAEAELALVIGREARNVAADDALDVVYGYTVANDVSAREIQFADGQWFRGKGYDTFCPLRGEIVPVSELGDAADLRVTQTLNGKILQDQRTSELIFGVRELVAYTSRILTLAAGDVILTGTPSGVGFFRDPPIALQPGDVVRCEVEGIGVLSNPVVAG